MVKNFHEVLESRNNLLHQKATYQEVIEHLSKFLDTDGTKASSGIQTEGGGFTVPQKIIELTIGDLQMTMADIDKELEQIYTSKVAEHEHENRQKRGEEEPKKTTKKGGSNKNTTDKRYKAKKKSKAEKRTQARAVC